MRPAKQGTLDALCGVYAVVNALKVAKVRNAQPTIYRDAFRHLIESIPEDYVHSALIDGLTADEVLQMSRRAFRRLRKHGVNARVSRPWTDRHDMPLDRYMAHLQRIHDRAGAAAIIRVSRPGYAHWTVARHLSAAWLNVKDSRTLKTIETSRFRVGSGPHRFWPEDTLLVTTDQP